jgi:hypothetical protein
MLPDWRAYLLALTPAGISAVQLVVFFYTPDKNTGYLADLLCVFLVSIALGRLYFQEILVLLTLLSVGQTIITFSLYESSPLTFLHRIIFYILFPFVLSHAIARYNAAVYGRMVAIAALGLAALNFTVFPVELIMRGGTEYLHLMNYSGRAYELFAVLLLAATITQLGALRPNGPIGLALFLTALLSFSRGALLVSMVVLGLTQWRKLKQVIAIRGMFVVILLVLGVGKFTSTTFFDAFEFFWTKRLNLIQEESIANNFVNFRQSSDREEIWSIALKHISEWPNFGTGITTAKDYISEATSGIYAFSGYHNLTLTVLAERGIFLGSLFLLLILIVGLRLIVKKEPLAVAFFGGFLLFAHTTGAELVIENAHVRNANVSLFLFLLYIRLLRHYRSQKSSQYSVENIIVHQVAKA